MEPADHHNEHHVTILVETHSMEEIPPPSPKGFRKKLPKFLKGHYRTKSTPKPPKKIVVAEHKPLVPGDANEELFRKDFLVRLAKALHVYGSPVYRTEYNMTFASSALGIQGMFAIFPTLLISSFGDVDRDPAKAETHILRVDQGLNCEKLHRVDELADMVIKHEIDAQEAKHRLDEIISAPVRYSEWVKLFSIILSSACIAPLFFNGGWQEILFSAVLGAMVGVLNSLCGKFPVFSRLLEPCAALLSAFVARVVSEWVPGLCFYASVLSAIIWLLPGLSLTISVMELATRNIVSGSARIFYALLLLLELGFGIALGNGLVFWNKEDIPTGCDKDPVNPWFFLPLFLGTAIPFNVLLDAHPRQWPTMTLTAGIGVFVPFALSYGLTDNNLISFISSFLIGICGTVYARYTHHPAIVPIISGIIMLVPGSIGVRGVSSVLIGGDIVSGIRFTFEMMTISMSITGGLLMAHLFVFPKKVLSPILL